MYVELKGPSVVDVHHNFIQRWNEASERHLSDGLWGQGSEYDLPFPTDIPERKGDAYVQIQRTVHSGRYMNGQASPQGNAFDINLANNPILINIVRQLKLPDIQST